MPICTNFSKISGKERKECKKTSLINRHIAIQLKEWTWQKHCQTSPIQKTQWSFATGKDTRSDTWGDTFSIFYLPSIAFLKVFSKYNIAFFLDFVLWKTIQNFTFMKKTKILHFALDIEVTDFGWFWSHFDWKCSVCQDTSCCWNKFWKIHGKYI